MTDYTRAIEITKEFAVRHNAMVEEYNKLLSEIYPNFVKCCRNPCTPQFSVDTPSEGFKFSFDSELTEHTFYVYRLENGLSITEAVPNHKEETA